jgi:hypothetical protein
MLLKIISRSMILLPIMERAGYAQKAGAWQVEEREGDTRVTTGSAENE